MQQRQKNRHWPGYGIDDHILSLDRQLALLDLKHALHRSVAGDPYWNAGAHYLASLFDEGHRFYSLYPMKTLSSDELTLWSRKDENGVRAHYGANLGMSDRFPQNLLRDEISRRHFETKFSDAI